MLKGAFHGRGQSRREAFTKPSSQARASDCGIEKFCGVPHSYRQTRINKEKDQCHK
jgi:hypothetical protein